MIVKNLTNQSILTQNAKAANSLKDRSLGLLLRSNPRALFFRTRWGIHTFGLKQPIDVVVLNQAHQIVKLRPNLPPNRLFLWNPAYDLILELPASTLKRSHTKVGDTLKFI